MKKIIFLIAVTVPVIALLYFSLTRDPRELPSALVGKAAPDFQLESLDGRSVALTDLKGSPVILNFWSTWCGSCLAEHQLIQEVSAAHPQIIFYSILYEDTVDNARDFLSKYGPAAPVLIDPSLRTAIDYGVAGVPETFFIDRDGIVRYKHSGPLTTEILWSKFRAIQKATADPEARIDRLGRMLRCPVCRGVPIAESPSAVAVEMMSLLKEQVKEGKKDAEILHYFEERYGEWVLLEPKPEGMNWGVWLLPGFFLVGGGVLILRRVRSSQLR